jgi:translocator protein
MTMRWISLLFWILLCFAVAGVSGSWTAREIPNWYRTLVRPSIAPPNWVFGPVWTVLYALMAVAAWRLSLAAPSPWRTTAIVLFAAQLALNFAWSLIFFRWHRIGWALVEVVILWAAILSTTFAFARVSSLAAWLMAPYLAWVSFASILNAAFWQSNKGLPT